MKVNEIRYERVTLEETKEKIAAAVDAVRGAKSGKDLAEIRRDGTAIRQELAKELRQDLSKPKKP